MLKNERIVKIRLHEKQTHYECVCRITVCVKQLELIVLICVTSTELTFCFFSCCSWLTTLGGGIPHGVFLESGGNTIGLTQHRTGEEGRHVPPCSPATTLLTTLASVSKRANSAGPQNPTSALSKGKGGKRGSVTWAPEPSCEFDPQSGANPDPKMATEPATNFNIKLANKSCSNLNNKTDSKPETNSKTNLGLELGTNLDPTVGTALGTNLETKSNAEPGTNSNANTNTSRPQAEQIPHPSTGRVIEPKTKPATEMLEKCKSSIDSSLEQLEEQENGNGPRVSGEEME